MWNICMSYLYVKLLHLCTLHSHDQNWPFVYDLSLCAPMVTRQIKHAIAHVFCICAQKLWKIWALWVPTTNKSGCLNSAILKGTSEENLYGLQLCIGSVQPLSNVKCKVLGQPSNIIEDQNMGLKFSKPVAKQHTSHSSSSILSLLGVEVLLGTLKQLLLGAWLQWGWKVSFPSWADISC